jgi:hypothetical protein
VTVRVEMAVAHHTRIVAFRTERVEKRD